MLASVLNSEIAVQASVQGCARRSLDCGKWSRRMRSLLRSSRNSSGVSILVTRGLPIFCRTETVT